MTQKDVMTMAAFTAFLGAIGLGVSAHTHSPVPVIIAVLLGISFGLMAAVGGKR